MGGTHVIYKYINPLLSWSVIIYTMNLCNPSQAMLLRDCTCGSFYLFKTKFPLLYRTILRYIFLSLSLTHTRCMLLIIDVHFHLFLKLKRRKCTENFYQFIVLNWSLLVKHVEFEDITKSCVYLQRKFSCSYFQLK